MFSKRKLTGCTYMDNGTGKTRISADEVQAIAEMGIRRDEGSEQRTTESIQVKLDRRGAKAKGKR